MRYAKIGLGMRTKDSEGETHILLDSGSFVVPLEKAGTHLEGCLPNLEPDGDGHWIEIVEMTPEEYDKLPDFIGW